MREVTEQPHPIGNGVQKLYRFDNGYGASVVQFAGSYGFEQGLWELAVIRWDNSPIHEDLSYPDGIGPYSIAYDTPITDDVIGYLTEMEVEEVLNRIEALPTEAAERTV
jgi:hypothetical protein